MNNIFTISILSGSSKGLKIKINEGMKITIGRDPKNDIIFDGNENQLVSRNHASIEIRQGKCIIMDHSSNGSYVNNEKYSKNNTTLKNDDIISLVKNREDLKINIIHTSKAKEKKDTQNQTSVSYTKIFPTKNPGFLKNITEQLFFFPSILTVFTCILLFWSINVGFSTYSSILGSYLCIMTLFFIRTISGLQLPLWILFISSILSIVMYYIAIPWIILEDIFRTPQILLYIESPIFLERFIGYFFAAGLQEELFKVIPIFIFISLKNYFQSLRFPGIINDKVSPLLTMLIGVSSAVGFIFHETIFDYVPRFSEEFGELVGLAILIPRIIGGIAGHVGFTGIFSYFIGLSFYYKKIDIKLILFGWFLSSLLHALWNSLSGNIFLGLIIATTTFFIFIIYLTKAKQSFNL